MMAFTFVGNAIGFIVMVMAAYHSGNSLAVRVICLIIAIPCGVGLKDCMQFIRWQDRSIALRNLLREALLLCGSADCFQPDGHAWDVWKEGPAKALAATEFDAGLVRDIQDRAEIKGLERAIYTVTTARIESCSSDLRDQDWSRGVGTSKAVLHGLLLGEIKTISEGMNGARK